MITKRLVSLKIPVNFSFSLMNFFSVGPVHMVQPTYCQLPSSFALEEDLLLS